MKRSEMLEQIAEVISGRETRYGELYDKNKHAEYVLFVIEKLGMLPPARYLPENKVIDEIKPSFTWTPEDEK